MVATLRPMSLVDYRPRVHRIRERAKRQTKLARADDWRVVRGNVCFTEVAKRTHVVGIGPTILRITIDPQSNITLRNHSNLRRAKYLVIAAKAKTENAKDRFYLVRSFHVANDVYQVYQLNRRITPHGIKTYNSRRYQRLGANDDIRICTFAVGRRVHAHNMRMDHDGIVDLLCKNIRHELL
jgi:hypothetical protein